tara:strand:+ start:287 stop:454 length:168 start_codon:yes stop_codon:yes gene_type:complete
MNFDLMDFEIDRTNDRYLVVSSNEKEFIKLILKNGGEEAGRKKVSKNLDSITFKL